MYAWVWCIFGGPRYLSGIFPSVFSLKGKTKHDCVLLYTRDVCVNNQGEIDATLVKTFSEHFDKVVEVDYITVESKPMKTKKQNTIYSSWIDKSYTKWNILRLTEYSKVMFIDSDVIFLDTPVNDIDTLFELKCPAGTFSTPWGNRFTDNFGIDIKMYPQTHGDTVSHKTITHTIKTHKNCTAVIGTMLLLEPNMDHFLRFKEYISTHTPYGYSGCNSGFDEQSITMFYSDILKRDWTFIHQRYNFIPWKQSWLEKGDTPYVYHYFNKDKPWDMEEGSFEDLKPYYDVVKMFLYKYPKNNYIKTKIKKV